jgi:hypothetical protein
MESRTIDDAVAESDGVAIVRTGRFPQAWEFTILADFPTIDDMNELGSHGWELVCVSPLGTVYFKRPKVRQE